MNCDSLVADAPSVIANQDTESKSNPQNGEIVHKITTTDIKPIKVTGLTSIPKEFQGSKF